MFYYVFAFVALFIKDADHYYEAKARCGMRAPEHDELRKGRNPYLNYIILR